jgi:hypothetical protein
VKPDNYNTRHCRRHPYDTVHNGLDAFNISINHLKQKIASYQSPLTLEGGEIGMKSRVVFQN